LLFISDSGIDALKNAGTFATLLPGTAYFTRLPYAPARKLIESGRGLLLLLLIATPAPALPKICK
jgi:imidazolonepropionase